MVRKQKVTLCWIPLPGIALQRNMSIYYALALVTITAEHFITDGVTSRTYVPFITHIHIYECQLLNNKWSVTVCIRGLFIE